MMPFMPLRNPKTIRVYSKTIAKFCLFLLRVQGSPNLPIRFGFRDRELVASFLNDFNYEQFLTTMKGLLLQERGIASSRDSFPAIKFVSISAVGVGLNILDPSRRTQIISHLEWFLRALVFNSILGGDLVGSLVKFSNADSGLNSCAWALRESKRLLYAAVDPLYRSFSFEWGYINGHIRHEYLVHGKIISS